MSDRELLREALPHIDHTTGCSANRTHGDTCDCAYRKLKDRITARLSEPEDVVSVPSDGWLPIKTAPKDGRMAIVYRPLAHMSQDEPVAVKRLIGGNHHCWKCTVPKMAKPFNPTDGACHVTHWQPLPAPPKG